MASRDADGTLSMTSGWSVPSNKTDAAHTRGGEPGAAAAEELSGWLAQVLVEERQALRSALERSHQESWATLDEELGRRHRALAAQLQERCQAGGSLGDAWRSEPLGGHPSMPSQGKFDGRASQTTTSATQQPTSQSPSPAAPKLVLQDIAPFHATSAADDTDKKDSKGLVATRTEDDLAQGERPSRLHRLRSASFQRRVNTMLFKETEHDFRRRWAKFVESARFEALMAVLIMLNGFQMALEVQHSGLLRGHGLGYRDYAKNPDPWPGAKDWFNVFSNFFGAVFTCEVALKMFIFRTKFFKSGWNLFDLFVVLCFLVEVSAVAEEGLGDTTALRLARLARLLRLVRVLRQIQDFDTLFLMTTALRSSMYVLVWSCALLFIIQALVAFSINQLLEEFYFGDDHPQQEQAEVFKYFGSFSRALLSTFEMALANWPPVCRLLMENVSEWFMVICLLHKLTVGFAVVGIINGVFVQQTLKTAEEDDFIMLHQRESAERTHRVKMERLFQAGDESGDGYLCKEEWLQLTRNPEVKMWLSSMGLDTADGDALFGLIDVDKDDRLSIAEVIEGVSKLKGAARSLDLVMCGKKQEELYQDLLDVHPEIGRRRRERGLRPTFTRQRTSPFVSPVMSPVASAPTCEVPCMVVSDAW